MKQRLRGFLLIIITIVQIHANTFAAPSFATPSLAINPNKLMLADSAAANTNPLATQTASGNSPKVTSHAPVDPNVTQQTQSVFQNTQQNLSLYVTQLQCQSQGINSNTCNSQNSSNPGAPTVLNNVDKFLFNSVTSELGVGVEVNF